MALNQFDVGRETLIHVVSSQPRYRLPTVCIISDGVKTVAGSTGGWSQAALKANVAAVALATIRDNKSTSDVRSISPE